MSKSIFLISQKNPSMASMGEEVSIKYQVGQQYIKQISPASGYVSVFSDKSTEKGYFTSPVVAWALCDSYDEDGEITTDVLSMEMCSAFLMLNEMDDQNYKGTCRDDEEEILSLLKKEE